jgi:hypothetical protein
MSEGKKTELKNRIINEMTDDYSNALEKNFELAKQMLRITKEGKVNILCKEKLAGEEKIALYLIGRLYAKEAGFTQESGVDNKELMDELGIPIGSLLPWLKSLRDKKKIKQRKEGRRVIHIVPVNLVERTLKEIEKKVKKIGSRLVKQH